MSEYKTSPALLMPQVSLANELNSSLPLEHTLVTVQITGPVATVMVKQRFGNPLSEPTELDYLFPLPENAAITDFELQIGQRRIKANLREREAAQNDYDEARGQGKRAGLFEQRRPNLFAVRLANVQAGETIYAVVRYQQRLKFDDVAYEFVYPMGITPKYNSQQHPGEDEGVHAPIARGEEAIGSLEISLSIDAGVSVGAPESPSHPIEVARLDERRFHVQLAGEHIPDHDFVLRYRAAAERPQAVGWISGEPEKAFFLASVIPPEMDEPVDPLPREFVFVLDRSGSMSGEPILQARNALRACMRALNLGDTFRILLFDNTIEWFQPESVPVTQEQIERADTFLNSAQGRGGTEIVQALEAALTCPEDEQRTRFVVFLTDGAVSAEMRVLEGIRKWMRSARLFTFGIGSSVNRALLNRMAELGRGTAAFLQLNEDIEGTMIRFQDSVSFPMLTDLNLNWEGGKAWDVYPSRLPDLYDGQPLEICGRVARGGSTPIRLTLRGKRSGQPFSLAVTLPDSPVQDKTIERLWAQARIADLNVQAELEPNRVENLRAEILGLALEYNLVTAYTSFVAADQVSAVSSSPRIFHVAQPLPQGLQPGVYGPGIQQPGMVYSAMMMPSAPPPAQASTFSLREGAPSGPLLKMAGFRETDVPERHVSHDTQPMLGSSGVVQRQPGRVVNFSDRESGLRWLARTQNIDGSWNEDIERTAVALLAFVRADETTRTGSYRQALRRSVNWLMDHMGDGLACFLRALAFEELAAATHADSDRKKVELARQNLPNPANDLEAAALRMTVPAVQSVHSLDDLRLAALQGIRLPVPASLAEGSDADLVQVWSILL